MVRNRTLVKGGSPVEDLDRRRDGDQETQDGENHSGVDGLAADKHVVTPYEEADRGDGQAGESDKVIAKDVLSGETGDQLADHAHAWQDHDVNGRMGVKPEEVLEQDRISTQSRIEDPDVETPFQNQQNQRDGHNRRPQDHDEAGGVVRPDEERQTKPGQAWSTHLVDRHDEVQTR